MRRERETEREGEREEEVAISQNALVRVCVCVCVHELSADGLEIFCPVPEAALLPGPSPPLPRPLECEANPLPPEDSQL